MFALERCCSHISRAEPRDLSPWPVVRQVLEFAGLPALDEVQQAVAKGAANHNSGAKWGGKDYKAKLQPLERKLLHDYYAPHNKELYELIGRDMGWEAMGSITTEA